ncbi:UPF0481 protein At3g47200-like [Phragmites australis]|uniref:UPF0481 protein At3g47200-like n=1 Tax=Phragmites australis TaxID=29695 RepID=UPI002D7745E5|nr:UPF0481 protein At3g47200-like [Phragmites australis]
MSEHSTRAKEKQTVEVPAAMRAEEKGNCSSLVFEMENMYVDTDLHSVEIAHWKKTSIYRVPEWVKRITNVEAYRPWAVSLGPFHHDDPDLLPMEEHKLRAVHHMVKRSGKQLREFVAAIEAVADELQEAYDNLDYQWRGLNKCRFVEMMVTDGCFLLELKRMAEIRSRGEIDEDYAVNDPVFSDRSLHYLRSMFQNDIIMMENQLPLLVLQTLLGVQDGASPSQSAEQVNNMVAFLLDCELEEGNDSLGLHPLHIFHRSFCGPSHLDYEGSGKCDSTMPSAVELSKAGIHFKKSSTESIRDVDFKDGILFTPLIEVHDYTEKIFLNLMAFERLHRDVGNDVTNFIYLMGDIINTGADVMILRSKGVMEQLLGSDEEVAKLFNSMSKGATMSPFSKLNDVQRKVNDHCRKPWNKWRASFVQTYLSNPWVFISLLAGVILLITTLLQTVYTVAPYYTKRWQTPN